MSALTLMQPHPGDWILPLMHCAYCAESERRDVVVLVFQAKAEHEGAPVELSVRAPITAVDAEALLERLLEMRAAGLLSEPVEA